MRGCIHLFPYTAYGVLLYGAQVQLSQWGHTRLSVRPHVCCPVTLMGRLPIQGALQRFDVTHLMN
jgi:hypothetical protein